MQALRREYDAYYIWLRRHPVVSGPGDDDEPVQMSVAGLLRFIWRFRRDRRRNVYFNSTNTYFPA